MDRSRPTLSRRRKVAGEGEPEVYAADEQGIGVDMMRWVGLARRVLISEGVRGNAELNMLFVDEASIAELNESFLDKQGPTDVLAFPIDGELDIATGAIATGPGRAHPDLDDLPLLLGDVVICPAVALAQASDHAGTFDDEMALQNARDVYTRRGEALSIWIIPSKSIIASEPADRDSMLEPSDPERKPYRHPTFYDIPDEVGHM